MKKRQVVTLKELHAKTGEIVRQAGQSKAPIKVTDRGRVIAVLSNLRPSTPPRPRKRVLLPEYQEMLNRAGKGRVLEDLDAVRGER